MLEKIRSRSKGIMEFKKTKVWLGFAAVIILLILGCILLTNRVIYKTYKSKSIATDNTLNILLEHRSRYIGDASNVSNLLDKLPYGKNKEGIELATDNRPYGITIKYRLDDVEASNEDIINNVNSVLQDNALILFSLIENVDKVNFNILELDLEVQFDRTEMQRYFDKELWEYSSDKNSYEEFLLNIYFKIFIYPEKYSMSMSSIPGMQIVAALNAALYNDNYSVKWSTENGSLLTWDRSNGKITNHGKSIVSTLGGPVYWSPLGLKEAVREDEVTISVLNTDGVIITEKHISMEGNDAQSYSVKPSYDIYYDISFDLE